MNLKEYYKDKTVIVTGHTGFKGSWLSLWLNILGAKVIGLSDKVYTNPSHYEIIKEIFSIDLRGDIKKIKQVHDLIDTYEPDFIFHLAAQSIVKTSYQDPLNTFETNALGTVNLLESLRKINPNLIAVLITSDKSYQNVEKLEGYKEEDKLGGSDPYSASKAAADIFIESYSKSFFVDPKSRVKISTARAGNVIGGGDWSSDRVIPDCIKAWSRNKKAKIKSPQAIRPWQHVLEPLSGYLTLGAKLLRDDSLSGEAFNFGPDEKDIYTVEELVQELAKSWSGVKWTLEKDPGEIKESMLLNLNCDKAKNLICWDSALSFTETAKWTAKWYKKYYEDESKVKDFSFNQIESYSEIYKKKF